MSEIAPLPTPAPDRALLHQVEGLLATWSHLDEWSSLLIDYHPPVVWRLWRQWGAYRILLHRIFPCTEGKALWHPHRWPSIVRIVKGGYWMRVGYGAGIVEPACALRLWLAGDSVYIMDNPDAWHAVEPNAEDSYSLMITGAPWQRAMPVEPQAPLQALTPGQAYQLLSVFRRFY